MGGIETGACSGPNQRCNRSKLGCSCGARTAIKARPPIVSPLVVIRYGFFTGSNVPENLNILRFETDFNELDVRNSAVARRVRWKQLMREHAGKIDLELAKRTYRCFYNGGIAGASEIPQRMVASGDSRPGRAALGSCESESWRSGMLRSRRWSRDEGFRAGRYYAAAKGCGWGQRPNSWTESSPFSHVGKAVTLGGGRG